MPTKPKPVMPGSVTGTLVSELTDAFREITALRNLREDLASWFVAFPDLSEQFGEWQAQCAERRAKTDHRR